MRHSPRLLQLWQDPPYPLPVGVALFLGLMGSPAILVGALI